MALQESIPSSATFVLPGSGADASGPLGEMHKALKATGFYPKKHPARLQLITQAHKSLRLLMDDKELVLVINRQGFTESDGGRKVTPTPMTEALARELFIRRIRRLTLLSDLSSDDLRGFLYLLTINPQDIDTAGGIDKLMADHGIRTIWSNEIDMAAILAKREAIEESEQPFIDAEDNPALHGVEEDNADSPLDGFDLETPEQEKSLADLIARLAEATEDSSYMELAKELARKSEDVKRMRRFSDLLPVLTALQGQGADDSRGRFIREYAMFTFEQIAGGSMTDFMLERLRSREYQEKDVLLNLLPSLGSTIVYAIIQQLCVADDLYARKILATALIRIGEPALPPIIAMLQDDRWYVVRNMVAILGEISIPSSIPALRKSSLHKDERVRKEVIRTLSRIKGKESEAIIIDLLQDRQMDIRRQAIASLGGIKARTAIQPLLQIALRSDFLLRQTSLRREAITALGRIGDRLAVQPLAKIIATPVFFFWKATEELKLAAAGALGAIGDESAITLLAKRAGSSSRLGQACREAIETIERIA
jgi:HEAT repeat protein